jgi:hypothetical protein
VTFAIHARTGGPETFDINAFQVATITSLGGGLDHSARGLERLLYQFQGEAHPLIQALAEAPLQVSTVLDQLLIDVDGLRWLDTAVGEQLDVVGAILGCEREGRYDSPYRTAIEAELLVLRSSGTVDQIFAPLDLYEPGNDGTVSDLKPLDPAGFRLSITDPVLDETKAERYRRVILRARSGAVHAWFYTWPVEEDSLFRFSDDGTYKADAQHGFGVGIPAREVIA